MLAVPLLLCWIATLLAACHTPPYRHTVHTFGAVDLERDAQLAATADALPWQGDYDDIHVLQGVLPPGLTFRGDSIEPVVEAGAEGRYAVLGTVTSEIPTAMLGALFWTAPAHPTASRYVHVWCPWQAPLRAVTLGFWALVPLNYGCLPTRTADVRLHARELKRMARAMGGNLVIISSWGGLRQYDRYGSLHTQLTDVSVTAHVFVDRGARP